jgi:hypothetical protein
MDRRDKAGIVKVMLTITPAHWLLQAQQSRMLAEATTDPEARETLLEIAGLYEKLGRLAADTENAALTLDRHARARRDLRLRQHRKP